MITVKAGKRSLLMPSANLTGICAEHLHNLAKRHRLGFFASAAESLGNQVEHGFSRHGLDCSDDAVPALRPLRSRPHCFIGGNFSARADYLDLLPLRATAPTDES